jgi:GTPase involved in cell partitioning and DNA repair
MVEEFDSETDDFVFSAREAIEQLQRITRDYPNLATQSVRKALETWDEDMFRKGELIMVQKLRAKAEREAMEQRANALIECNLTDDVLDMLNDEFQKQVEYSDLIDMVGKDRYIAALTREAIELQVNSISPEQAAELWNASGKPPVGGDRWTTSGVEVLMRDL